MPPKGSKRSRSAAEGEAAPSSQPSTQQSSQVTEEAPSPALSQPAVVAAKPTAAHSARLPQCAEAVGIVADWLKAQSTGSAAAAVPSPLALFAPKPIGGKGRAVPVRVTFHFVLPPVPSRIPILVRLPHDVHSNSNVCVVTPDPQANFTRELLEADDDALTNVAKIIDVTTLKAKFTTPVARRGLAKSFDTFFVHSDLDEYPVLLTGEFLSWQQPVWMDRGTKADRSFVSRLKATMSTVVVPRRGHETVSVTIGDTTLSPAKLTENAIALVAALVEKLTNGWRDVHGIKIEGATVEGKSISLPIYALDVAEFLHISQAARDPETAAPEAKKRRK